MAMRDSPNAPSQQAVLLLYQNVVVICMPDRFAALAHSESEAETRYYSVTPMNGVTGGTGEVWISPSPQFLPKPLLGGKGWLYLTVLAPPSPPALFVFFFFARGFWGSPLGKACVNGLTGYTQ